MTPLPPEIRDRTPAPHALRVGLRRSGLPPTIELALFCAQRDEPRAESGPGWLRLTWPETRESLLVMADPSVLPIALGFDHVLVVESGSSKQCFRAAYFVARRCGGVVQVRQRSESLAAGAFADRYLADDDLDDRWERAVGSI